MKVHYFEQDESDKDDVQLEMAKMQCYVPQTCLLGGIIVMSEITNGNSPCEECEGPREKCHGKLKRKKKLKTIKGE